MQFKNCLFLTTFTFFLNGCQLLAPYKGPITPTPSEWKTSYNAPDAGELTIPPDWKKETENSTSEHREESKKSEEEDTDQTAANDTPPSFEDVRRDLGDWWEVFHDPILNQLENEALDSSYTLWAALERVIEARAQAIINFAPLLPSLNFAPSFNRNGSLFQNPLADLGTGGSKISNISPTLKNFRAAQKANAASGTNAIASLNDFRYVQTQYLIPINLNYEIDLWGQLNNAYYASLIRTQAASQAYLSVLLSLTADIASTYFQIRGLDAQEEVIDRNIAVRQHAVDLNRARYKAGLIVYLDVSRAEVELARAKADRDDVRRLRGLQVNSLATLIGLPASVFSLSSDPARIPPPVIPRGLPSELLCRRPDIAEAERKLAAAYREIGVAYANFFPSLSINASLGFETPFAHQLFSWYSRFWSVGWNVMQTVFDAGRNEANYDYYKSLFRESMANYQETVLQGFKDVEDALVNLNGYANQAKDLKKAVQAARTTLELAQMRYNKGLTNYLDVVDAERQLLETEQNSVIVLSNRYVSTVMLIRALGGGWGPCENCEEDKDDLR